MGKILIVEPYRILQQAMSLALLNDHETESRENLEASELETLAAYDLIVIDAWALKEKSPEADPAAALRRSRTPVLWLDTEELSRPLRQEGFASLKLPLDRSSFLSAVDELISGKAPARPAAAGVLGSGNQPSETPDSELIDLVEVVDDKDKSGLPKKKTP